MKIELRPLAEIFPYPTNARKIPQSAIDSVAKSLLAFGWQQPIVVDQAGVIVVGHTRRLAALQLGWTEAPVTVFEGTAAQARQYRLMDNRSHEDSSWEPGLLTAEMLELRGLDLDLSLTGFNSRELDGMLRPAIAGEDDAPPVPDTPFTQPGDLWTMGEHRLLCGDATDADAVKRVCGEAKPFLMVTDPPYGVDYDPDWRNRADRANGLPDGARAIGVAVNDDRAAWSQAFRLFCGDVAYVWHGSMKTIEAGVALQDSDFVARAVIIWAKPRHVISRGHYHWQHEPCWYAVRKGKQAHWSGDRSQTTIWTVEHQKSETGHSNQKPVEVMRRPVLNHTKAGAHVYDPFLGSGTTLVACELTERRCIAVDIDPKYVDVAVRRWMNLTGKVAYNQDGVCFPT